jgi:hypothetical protein
LSGSKKYLRDADQCYRNRNRRYFVPDKNNIMRIGFDSEEGTAIIYLYSLSGDLAGKFSINVRKGVNMVEEPVRKLSTGIL